MNKHNSRPNPVAPLTTIQSFSSQYPEITVGSLRWLVFNKREELIERDVIRYWGSKVLIHRENFFTFIMEGRTEQLS